MLVDGVDMEGEGAGEDVVEDVVEDMPTLTTATPKQPFKRVDKSIIWLRIVARIRLIDHLLLLSPRCILFSTADVTLGLAFLVSFRGLPVACCVHRVIIKCTCVR
jgi:hypothetical protein